MQKKAIRVVMPGYVNYFYKDGQLHTYIPALSSFLIDYRLLTIHRIIASNALNFMHKAKCFQSLLPSSVKQTIADTVININMLNQSDSASLSWLAEFYTHIFRTSLFLNF